MNLFDDALYRIHEFQAARRNLPPVDYFEFLKGVTGRSDTDLSQLFLPPRKIWFKPIFQIGPVWASPSTVAQVDWFDMLDAVAIHSTGHWGEVSPKQWLANDRAVANGGRICSAHRSIRRVRFWVITEADRSQTSMVMPGDWWFPGGLP